MIYFLHGNNLPASQSALVCFFSRFLFSNATCESHDLERVHTFLSKHYRFQDLQFGDTRIHSHQKSGDKLDIENVGIEEKLQP
jgi:hypothetical protein